MRTISLETISSVLYSKIPLRLESAAALNAAFISSTVAAFLITQTQSVIEPVATGTLREWAAILPFKCGNTVTTALAAPVPADEEPKLATKDTAVTTPVATSVDIY